MHSKDATAAQKLNSKNSVSFLSVMSVFSCKCMGGTVTRLKERKLWVLIFRL